MNWDFQRFHLENQSQSWIFVALSNTCNLLVAHTTTINHIPLHSQWSHLLIINVDWLIDLFIYSYFQAHYKLLAKCEKLEFCFPLLVGFVTTKHKMWVCPNWWMDKCHPKKLHSSSMKIWSSMWQCVLNSIDISRKLCQKNRSQNRLQFFWPTWFAIAKWPHLFFKFSNCNSIFFLGGGGM